MKRALPPLSADGRMLGIRGAKIFGKILAKAFEGFCAWHEPMLARPGRWAGLWRRMGVKAALAARMG